MPKQAKQTPQRRAAKSVQPSGDTIIRDDIVPELARRVRGKSAKWVVYWRQDGRLRKTTLGDCAAIAIDRARDLARNMLGLEVAPDARSSSATSIADFANVFLEDCAGRWKPSTLKTNRNSLKTQILPHIGKQKLGSIRREDVLAWMNDLGLSKGANNRALSVFSSLCVHAELRGLVPPESNPCKGLRRHETSFQARYLTELQIGLLGEAFDALHKDHPQAINLLRFLTLTGCRRGEALGLEWSMIDGKRAALPDAKSGPKSIWLGQATRRLIASCPRQSQFVFGIDDCPLTAATLTPVWADIRERLNMPTLRIHDLRHSFASVALGLGHDLLIVGGLLGHSDKGSTAGYAHLTSRDVADASARVGTHFRKVMQRKTRKPRCHNTNVAAFLRSKDKYTVFCRKHGLDVAKFRRDLVAWRKTQQAWEASQ